MYYILQRAEKILREDAKVCKQLSCDKLSSDSHSDISFAAASKIVPKTFVNFRCNKAPHLHESGRVTEAEVNRGCIDPSSTTASACLQCTNTTRCFYNGQP